MELGLDVKNIGPGGGGFQDTWQLLQGGSTGSALIRLKYMDDDPTSDQPNPSGFPPQGGPPAGGYATVSQ